MGLVFATLGDGWWQSTIIPMAYSLVAVLLFCRLVEQLSSRRAAMLGGIVFVATAAFADLPLVPNIDTVELALVLAAANAGTCAVRRRSVSWAAGAGLILGVAAQARMTSLTWLPVIAVGALCVPVFRRLAPATIASFFVPLGLEAAVYGLWAGRPILSQQLSAAHTRIPSAELSRSVDLSQSPLFNPQFIGGWRPKMGIHLHWTVDGMLNLLLHPQIGPLIGVALVLLWLQRKSLVWRDPSVIAAGLALLYCGALIFALAIDPYPRMFLPVVALVAFIVGRAGVEAWDRGERTVVGVLVGLIVAFGAIETEKRFHLGVAGPLAHQWASEHRGDIAVEDNSWRILTFDPVIRALPVAPSRQGHLLVLIPDLCWNSGAVASSPTGWSLTRSRDFGRPDDPLNLCEFRRVQPR
jgi:4-amino-4-deoxy-L-arabinose transferase-like glycosyltransferase